MKSKTSKLSEGKRGEELWEWGRENVLNKTHWKAQIRNEEMDELDHIKIIL